MRSRYPTAGVDAPPGAAYMTVPEQPAEIEPNVRLGALLLTAAVTATRPPVTGPART